MSGLWGRVAFTFPSLKAFPTLFSRAGTALVDIDAILYDEAWQRIEAAISLPSVRSLNALARSRRRLHGFLSLNPGPMRWLRDLSIVLLFDKETDPRYDILIDAPGLRSASFEIHPGSSISLSFTTAVLRRLEVSVDNRVTLSDHIAANFV